MSEIRHKRSEAHCEELLAGFLLDLAHVLRGLRAENPGVHHATATLGIWGYVYICICIYIYICIYLCIYICISIYICIYTYMYTYVYMPE